MTPTSTAWGVSPRGAMYIAHAETSDGHALCRSNITIAGLRRFTDEDLDQHRYGLYRCASCERKLNKTQ